MLPIIIGCVAGGVVLICLILIIVIVVVRKRRNSEKKTANDVALPLHSADKKQTSTHASQDPNYSSFNGDPKGSNYSSMPTAEEA